jgi:hypothetical protein
MLIATALAVALTVNVSVAPDVPPTLVSRALAETDDIWRSSGLAFAWQRAPREAATASLHVVIGHDVRPALNGGLALGWIVFEDSKPEQEIYLSYSNARQLMVESPGVVGVVDRMPILERETLLARAMGRALAHEIGHYVLASKAHTLTGLMRSRVTATEFFGRDNRTFVLDNGQQSSITAWLRREGMVASR